MLLYIAKIISASSAAKICNRSNNYFLAEKKHYLSFKWCKNVTKYCRAYVGAQEYDFYMSL
jgi:hypothetical protein